MNQPFDLVPGAAAASKDETGLLTSSFFLRYGAYLVIILVFGYFALRSSVFLTHWNLINVLRQIAVLAIASFGMTAVVMGGGTHIIAGGIDLSVGANVGLTVAVAAVLMRSGVQGPLAIAAALLTALTISLLNAVMVVYVKMLPLLATLAMMFTANGLELSLTKNTIVSVSSPLVRAIADGSLLGLPVPVVVLAGMFLFYYVLLHWTSIGIHIQAVGGNRDAAQTSGLPVRFYTILSYLLAGFAVGISALLVIARLTGSTPGVGGPMLLDVVLTTYVSAAFSRRWVVNIPGVLLGAVFVGILTNGFTLINVPTYWVHAVKGFLVLFVVTATSLQQRGKVR